MIALRWIAEPAKCGHDDQLDQRPRTTSFRASAGLSLTRAKRLQRPKSTTLIFRFRGCGPAISNPMTLFDFKLVAPDRLCPLEMYAASAENVASSRSRYAPPIVSPVVVAGGALQLAQKFPHRRAIRDAR